MERALVNVYVIPRSSRNQIARRPDGSWCLRLTAPPVEGAANKAAMEFLADVLKVRKSQVTLVLGEKSRRKTFEIHGLSEQEVAHRLAQPAH